MVPICTIKKIRVVIFLLKGIPKIAEIAKLLKLMAITPAIGKII
jgi:hypothetical protein